MTSLPVIIIGVNPFAIEVAHIFQINNVVIYGFLDDDPKKQGTEIGEIPVLGNTEESTYWDLIGKTCGVFVALENPIERKKMIETIEEEKLVDRAVHIGKILSEHLHSLAAKYPIIGEVRGRGAMQAIELVEAGTKTPNPAAMATIIKYCQSKGVLILTAGTYGNVMRFLPPIVISDELLKDALGVLEEAFASL